MEDLKNWKPRPAPAPVTLKGRFVTIEPYRRAEHAEALWDALGGPGVSRGAKVRVVVRYAECACTISRHPISPMRGNSPTGSTG